MLADSERSPGLSSPGSSPKRFTRDGSTALEDHLLNTCRKVRSAIEQIVPEDELDGLVLGGGYGRGEGGVLRSGGGEKAYNDLEFYVFVRGRTLWQAPVLHQQLRRVGEQLSPEAGVKIEFKATRLSRLRKSAPSMFYYDLVVGHRWLIGTDELLHDCEHLQHANRIPAAEATRLLMNRCSGLLFSVTRLERAAFREADADFVGRNIAKAQLALGDVVLTVHGRYHWSCLERERRLQELVWTRDEAWQRAIAVHHQAGVAFKLHPVFANESRAALAARLDQVRSLAREVWLWLESRRLGWSFLSMQGYALSRLNKCPEVPLWKNLCLNLGSFGPRAFLRHAATRHPRERLLTALALLLFEPAVCSWRGLLRPVQSALQTRTNHFSELAASYHELWSKFN
jgi:hypothetical protein